MKIHLNLFVRVSNNSRLTHEVAQIIDDLDDANKRTIEH